MNLPKKAKKCHDIIDEIELILDYFMGDTHELKSLKNNEIVFLRDYISEISESKKLTNIKLATKIKKELQEGNK